MAGYIACYIIDKVTEADLKGKWSAVIFYPADFTFVCPTELGDLADHYDELQKMGVEVYAVSTDTHFTHKAWHDTSETIKKIKFNFPYNLQFIQN